MKEAVKPQPSALASKAGKAAADGQGPHTLGLLGPCSRFGTRSSAAVKAEVRTGAGAGGQWGWGEGRGVPGRSTAVAVCHCRDPAPAVLPAACRHPSHTHPCCHNHHRPAGHACRTRRQRRAGHLAPLRCPAPPLRSAGRHFCGRDGAPPGAAERGRLSSLACCSLNGAPNAHHVAIWTPLDTAVANRPPKPPPHSLPSCLPPFRCPSFPCSLPAGLCPLHLRHEPLD